MGITSDWDNDEKTIYRWIFEGKWAWADYYAQRDAANAAIQSVDHIVDVLVDLRSSNILPDGAITHAKNAFQNPPSNIGVTVVVGVYPIFRIFYNIFKQIYKLESQAEAKIQLVVSLEEAYSTLAGARSLRQ